jgi:uncharacterized protein
MKKDQKNVLGDALTPCCMDPITGFFRDGYCRTDAQDTGRHVVCVIVNDAFLAFSQERGNDLSTPAPQYSFPGLKDGDKWCLCALRWLEAAEAGMAPPVDLNATHEKVLQFVPEALLKSHAVN